MDFRRAFVVFVILTVGAAYSATAQDQPISPCRFTVSGGAAAKPKITGPDEITSRAIVVDQPGSPVEIVAADLTDTDLRVSGGSYSMRTAWQVTVRNRSDQPVLGVAVAVVLTTVRTRDGSNSMSLQGSGNRMEWKGALMPGGTATVVTRGGGGGGTATDATDMKLLLSVDRVEFADCTYQPAKAVPK